MKIVQVICLLTKKLSALRNALPSRTTQVQRYHRSFHKPLLNFLRIEYVCQQIDVTRATRLLRLTALRSYANPITLQYRYFLVYSAHS